MGRACILRLSLYVHEDEAMSDSKHQGGPRAALFDMDRTLIRKDTATLYMKHQRDRGRVRKRDALRVAWWLLQYTFGVVNAERVAEQAMQGFQGKREDWLE
ncbi:MAG: haloacid dehalogenase-like hydrolase, partial [Myxococcales bacterium]|nr:haloacid dehalogenase-like hydrolase [Myxococcales bacterium]